MPTKLKSFLADVASARAKSEAAEAEVINTLKGMSPAEFARVPRSVLSGLTNQQYEAVVKAIAPGIKLKQATPPALAVPKPKARLGIRWMPRSAAAAGCAIMLGTLTIFAVLAATPALERWSYSGPLLRTADVATWPKCPRLTRWTDGCLYQVTRGVSWSDAAGSLDIPETTLRELNRHIRFPDIPSGSSLCVWRYRFELQQEVSR
jgi:hypothetical protein